MAKPVHTLEDIVRDSGLSLATIVTRLEAGLPIDEVVDPKPRNGDRSHDGLSSQIRLAFSEGRNPHGLKDGTVYNRVKYMGMPLEEALAVKRLPRGRRPDPESLTRKAIEAGVSPWSLLQKVSKADAKDKRKVAAAIAEIRKNKAIQKENARRVQIALENGISSGCLSARLSMGWTLEEALYTPKRDMTNTLSAKARERGLSTGLVIARIQRGWSEETALETPVLHPRDRSLGANRSAATPGPPATPPAETLTSRKLTRIAERGGYKSKEELLVALADSAVESRSRTTERRYAVIIHDKVIVRKSACRQTPGRSEPLPNATFELEAVRDGKILSINAIGRICGVKPDSIINRLEAGMEVGLAVDRQLRWRRQDQESLAQLAKEAGCSSAVVYGRLKSGVPLKEALLATRRKARAGTGRFHTSRAIPGCMCDGCESVRARLIYARTIRRLNGKDRETRSSSNEWVARYKAKKLSAVIGLESKKEVLNNLIDEWEKMQ